MEKAKKLIFISCVITLIISTINVLDTELLTSTIDFIITITVFLTAISKQINLLKYNKLNKNRSEMIVVDKKGGTLWQYMIYLNITI